MLKRSMLIAASDATAPPVTSGLVYSVDAGNPLSYPGTGSIWTDLVNGAQGTLRNSPTYSASIGYFSFNGANQCVDYSIYPSAIPFGAAARTFSLWARLQLTSVNQIFFVQGGNAYEGCRITVAAAQIPPYQYVIETLNSISYFSETPATLTWLNIACTIPANARTIDTKVFINGVALTPYTYTAPNTLINTTQSWRLARSHDDSQFYPGSLAIVQVYDRVLSNSELLQNFDAYRIRFGV